MGNRLSKIYTRTGDNGSTGLGDGSRTAKDGLRIQTIGDIDELNCNIGVLCSLLETDEEKSLLLDLQHDLFDLGGELSLPGESILDKKIVNKVENATDNYNKELQPLKEFILPGGSCEVAQAHVCRAVCRRAARHLFSLSRAEKVNAVSLRFLNRLSDLLFVLARYIATTNDSGEIMWQRSRS